MKAWRVHEYGAPADALHLDGIDAPVPAAGEVLVRVEAVTLNFNDLDGIYGRYKTVPTPVPYTPGMEVLGVVEACGPGTDADAWVGRRVAAVPSGAYGGFAGARGRADHDDLRDARHHPVPRGGGHPHAVPPRVVGRPRTRVAARR